MILARKILRWGALWALLASAWPPVLLAGQTKTAGQEAVVQPAPVVGVPTIGSGQLSPGPSAASLQPLSGALQGLPGAPVPKLAPSALTPATDLPVAITPPAAELKAPQTPAPEKPASPLQGLLENAPQAAETAAKKDVSSAKEGTADNFYSAARLGSETPAESAVSADFPEASAQVSAAAALQPAPLKTSPAEQKVLDKIADELGPVIARAEAPGLYSVLETIFSRLSAAQQKLFPADAVSINHIHVIDTPVLNAFVYPMKAAGVRRSSNLVFVTTGLLRKMLGDDPAQLRAGLVRVVGVLSHELAHPLDNIDAEGILTNYGKEIGGQAREVRADSEGAMIAKEAGYPVDSVYESLKRLFAGEADRGGILSSMSSTHPQNDLRLAMQRMLLTMDRYEKGTRIPSYPEDVPPAVLSELAGIDQGAAAGRFHAPKDLAEALARLQKLSELKRGAAYKEVEFNRLVLSVDALLAKRGADLGDEEFRLFTDINRLLAKPGGGLDLADRARMNLIFTEETHSQEFLAYPSHETFMKKVPAYNSQRYLDWVQANYFTKTDPSYGSAERGLNALAKILPSAPIFALFSDRIAEELLANMRSFTSSRYIYDQSVAKGKSPEFQARLAVLFHKKVMPRLSHEERIAFFIESTHDTYSYVFPEGRDSTAKNYSLGILKQRMRLMGDPRLKGLAQDYREALQSIWDNRGYYGTLDLILAFNVTDWDSIFAVLGIAPQAGRSQLRQAVKAFAETPAYAGVVKTVQASSLDAFRMLKMGHPMGKIGELSWLDDTLGPHLRADSNESLKAEPELHKLAKQLFAGSYYQSRREVFQNEYGRALAAALAKAAGKPMSVAELGALHGSVMDDLVGGARVSGELAGLQAEALSRSPLSAENRKELLQAVFLEGYEENLRVSGLTYDRAGAWLSREGEGSKTVLRVLVKNGLAQDARDLFARLLARDDFRKSAKGNGYSSYVSAVSGFKDDLLSGLDQALARESTDQGKAAQLILFLEAVADPADGDYPAPETLNTPELRDIKTRAAALASGLEVDFRGRLKLFRLLTGTGATPATDAFFQKRLEPAFDDAAAAAAALPLSAILEQGRIAGSGLQLSLTRRLLEPEVARLRSQPQDPEGLNRLIETINAYVRQGSLKKDEYLESLAWRLNLSGKELGAFVEDEKSYNWRKANPMLLRFGSALSGEIAKLSPKARSEFIAFLIEPEGRELPDPILKELQRNAYSAALAIDAAKDSHSSKAEIKKESDRAAYLMKLEIEAALIDASPFERIPLFELLLSAGGQALQNAEDFPENVTRAFLQYQPDSKEEKMLKAYLRVVPAHERTVSLAYLLSQAGENKSSVKHIFEVFQTVGVKFGQLSSTWKLFGDEVARETASLKNDARPMTKAEILEAMQRELTPEELARIKTLKKVIGSASLKTVVVVELTDGREVVMLLRRPHAAEQIETNLRLGQEFLRELDHIGMSQASAMFDAVLDAVRQQLAEELKFTKEAESIRTAKKHFEGLNSSMRAKLGGWRFAVPDLVEGFQVRDSILFMEKAAGTTYDKLSPEMRAQAGPLIADSALSLLFRQGWFDADRHTGNQLIDPEKKIIYPIDFGQAAAYSKKGFWQSDDRYELAQFLRAFSERDADLVLFHGAAMAGGGGSRDLSALREELRKVLAGEGSMSDRLIALVSAFTEQGLRLDGKFTFGAFKGLMTLYGESYVSEEGFRALLAREIASLLKRKFPRTLADSKARR
ncbi:MAG: AarF/UbiB family protein [Elusimicrobia bacterium]|nr:AarF/UbiB family protein [Elusimicrobiota bacterium]